MARVPRVRNGRAAIEVIAEEIEDPFGTEANDLPTDAISDTIRANLHDIL